jgi:hypothetical protein
MESYHYIYYPYINFRSETWLKKMALYADSVSRIVPGGYPTRMTETVSVLSQEKFIVDLQPWEAGPAPAKEFARFVIEHADELRPIYAIDKEAEWRSDLEDEHVRHETKSNRAYVEASKLTGADLDAMQATNLIIRGRDQEVNWIGMHPRMANVFMTLLMNGIVQSQPYRRPVADFASNVVDVHIKSFDGIRHALLPGLRASAGKQRVRDLFVGLSVEQVAPKDLDAISIEQILKLREKYADERLRYQKAVDELTESMKYMEHMKLEELQRDLIQKYDATVKVAVADLDKAFVGMNLKTAISSLSVSFAAPTLLELIDVAFDPIVAAISGGMLLLSGIAHDRQEAKKAAIKQCDYAWLYRIENELKPEHAARDLAFRARTVLR